MKLSKLQKYILKQCINNKGDKITRAIIYKFYNGRKDKPKIRDMINIITKSIERLIKKELIVGFGHRTAHKWFINEVKLTPMGKKAAFSLLGKQQKLPLKIRKRKK